jgi:hypothetical protein
VDAHTHKQEKAAKTGALLPANKDFLWQEQAAAGRLQLDLMALVVLKQLKPDR